jgi:hypothetical protein
LLDEIRKNPVFVRLTARSGWPSLRLTVVLYIVLMAFILWLIAQEVLQIGTFSYSSTIIFWGALLTFLVSPALFGIMTSFMTAQYAQGDLLPLMVMSGLDAGSIVRGYLAAALYRLRVLWALYFMMPPLMCVAVGLSLSPFGAQSLSFNLADLLAVIVPWIWPVFSGTVLGIALNLLAICNALNFVLTDRRKWHGISSSLFISGTWGVGGLASLAGACVGVPLIVAVAVLVMCLYSYNGAKNGVQRAVNRQIEVTA